MSKYIKFDDAVKIMACEMYAEAQSQGYDVDGIEDFMPEAKAWLNDAPSIDIVRCGECVHCADDYIDVGMGTMPQFTCELGRCGESVQPNDFCSYGERLE